MWRGGGGGWFLLLLAYVVLCCVVSNGMYGLALRDLALRAVMWCVVVCMLRMVVFGIGGRGLCQCCFVGNVSVGT